MSQRLRLRLTSSLPRCCISSLTSSTSSRLEIPVPTSLCKHPLQARQSSLHTLAGITLLLPTLLRSSISRLSAKASSKQVLRMTAEAGIPAVVLPVEDGTDHVQITTLTISSLHTSTNILPTNQMAQASHIDSSSHCLYVSLSPSPRRRIRLPQTPKALDPSNPLLTTIHTQLLVTFGQARSKLTLVLQRAQQQNREQEAH